MRRLISAALLLLLLASAVPWPSAAHAQAQPQVFVRSQYTLDRYGFAVVTESVQFVNNGTSAVQAPDLTFGFGNLSSKIVAYNFTGTGFSLNQPALSGPFTVTGTIQTGNSSSFALSVLLNGVVSIGKNGSLQVLTLSSPSLNTQVYRVLNVVEMPASTTFVSAPAGLKGTFTGTNNTYSSTLSAGSVASAVTSVATVAVSPAEDFNPLRVYSANRTITIGPDGRPMVTDSIEFQNMGTNSLTSLHVSPLTSSSARITIVTQTQPRLLSSFSTALSGDAIDLTSVAVSYPTAGVPGGANYSISFRYPLAQSYYSVGGDGATLNIPTAPPVPAFIDTYAIRLVSPAGMSVGQAPPQPFSNVSPWQSGQAKVAYSLNVGWQLSAGVPTASILFVLLLIGLFVSRVSGATGEEETEEESSTEVASAMIKAFDEKTTLVNSLWPEIASMDPNDLGKEYFDELRGRLGTFRSKAVQRLNEVRQRSTSQKFSDLLNQIQVTEREVDRAVKDKLNLYEQFYLRRMRKEVYDRLLPQYTKRLERALNELSDELHVVQREAKLL